MEYLQHKLNLKRQVKRLIEAKDRIEDNEDIIKLEEFEKEFKSIDYNAELEVMKEFTAFHNKIMRGLN